MEGINRTIETVTAEVIGSEFRDYGEFKQEFDRIIHKAAESFVEVGYMLRIAQDTNLVREAGYKNMEEFAKAEYGIDKSQASRFININKAFSEGCYSRVLQTRYQGMGVAKLGMMLTLPMSINEELTPDFSKEEIRAVKDEVDEEKKVSELEVWMEGEKEPQAGLSTLLEKAVHQLGEDDPGMFLMLWRFTEEYMQHGDGSGLLKRLSEELAPSGDAIYSVRIQGTGRMLFSMKEGEESFKLVNVRQDEKEEHALKDILDILWRLSGGRTCDGKEAWETVYGRGFPEEKKEEAPKKENRVVKAKTESTKKEDTKEAEKGEPAGGEGQITGQANIEDYPEYLPDGYEKEKVAPVQQEEETEKGQENVIKTGAEAEDGSNKKEGWQQAPGMEEDAALENAVEGATKETAVLEGMSLPEPEWRNDDTDNERKELVARIGKHAKDIAETVAENAFFAGDENMRKLELAHGLAYTLADEIDALIEMIKKEAYQE